MSEDIEIEVAKKAHAAHKEADELIEGLAKDLRNKDIDKQDKVCIIVAVGKRLEEIYYLENEGIEDMVEYLRKKNGAEE